MATLYVTADKRFVPAGDPAAVRGVSSADIDREGLRDAYDDFIQAKAMPKPKNKMARKAANK